MEKKMEKLMVCVLALAVLLAGATAAQAARVTDGRIVAYDFTEGSGDQVTDRISPALDLTIQDMEKAEWGAGFLSINEDLGPGEPRDPGRFNGTIISAPGTPAMKLYEAITDSEAITVEVWVTPELNDIGGPARIVTYSDPTEGGGYRNFTLGPQNLPLHPLNPSMYASRLRSSVTSSNGMPTFYEDPVGYPDGSGSVVPGALQHVIFTRDAAGIEKIYVDGSLKNTLDNSGSTLTGDPDSNLNWDNTYEFALANETHLTDLQRRWPGELHIVVVYNRALSASEVSQNYDAGADAEVTEGFYNTTPQVDAGPFQSVLVNTPLQLDATVIDDGLPEPPALTYTWSKLSGPGNVAFTPGNDIEDPSATFDAVGMYELQLSASDGEKDACDVVQIYARADNNPIAHWDFDEGSGSTVDDDSANNNVGDRAGDSEPNWVSGWVGNNALEFFGTDTVNSYVEITTDAAPDPNIDNLRYEISLSAWIKTIETDTVIIANGKDTWRMGLSSSQIGKLYFSCNGTDDPGLYSESIVNDGYWHHVAAVYNGSTASFYVDGIFDSSVGRTGLIDTNGVPVTIGARLTSDELPEKCFNGMLDDVRVYSYGLSADQVVDLAAMGNLVPRVDAGEDETFSMQYSYLQLDGTLTDDGKPVAATIEWAKTSGPGDVAFSDTAIEDPCVTFDAVGIYVLRLTADDTMATVYDEVTITVENPTCQDVIDDGLLLLADLSGPEGTPDCYVDLFDFAAFAGNWLRCNDPQNPECEFPY